jgi:hypothetical protein
MGDNASMPRYSYSLENGIRVADPQDATEDIADNRAAMDHAKLIARDLARSTAARNHLRVVVRNEAGDEIGDVPLQVDLR